MWILKNFASLFSELRTIDISCKSMYDKLLKKIQTQPTSIKYWEEKFGSYLDKINWKEIDLLQRSSTIESYTRAFQYKIINNALFLNKKLFKMGLIDSPTCSFYRLLDESPVHFLSVWGDSRVMEQTSELAVSSFDFTRAGFVECPSRIYTIKL